MSTLSVPITLGFDLTKIVGYAFIDKQITGFLFPSMYTMSPGYKVVDSEEELVQLAIVPSMQYAK